jgi:hypothetical protein
MQVSRPNVFFGSAADHLDTTFVDVIGCWATVPHTGTFGNAAKISQKFGWLGAFLKLKL